MLYCIKGMSSYSLKGKKIWVAGHSGMVGSALVRRLSCEPCEILSVDHGALDLCNQAAVKDWMRENKPDAVILAAARVGGIQANADNPASFFYDNMMIAANVIHSAYECGVEKLLFLGSSCIYPKECAQPIEEEALLSGALEPTNEAYALAKIAGLKMAAYYRMQYNCDFISAMPCNLFGVGDTYDEQNSHVIPALIMKAHRAKEEGADHIVIWGTGAPLREFLYVDDLADGLVFLLRNYSAVQHINIGTSCEIEIKNLARIICARIGFDGDLCFDETSPDGTLIKRLKVSKLHGMGWEPPLLKSAHGDFFDYLSQGIDFAYADFLHKNKQSNVP